MPTANRMNRKPESRATLLELERKGVLRRERIGIRNIIHASTGGVQRVGFDINELHGSLWRNPQLLNFCPAAQFATGWVGYGGARAFLSATQGRAEWEGHPLDLSSHFPVNALATELLNQPCTKNASFSDKVPILGDAVLTTDHRQHWILRPYRREYSEDELSFFASMIATPHDLMTSTWRPSIFFHEEPREIDIIAMKLKWS